MKQAALSIGLFLLVLIGSSMNVRSQDAKEFFGSTEVKTTWLGIDYSQVRAMGDVGATPSEMKDRYFESINELVITESEKYNVAKAFKKTNVSNDLSMVAKINSKIDADKIKTSNSEDLAQLNPEKVNKIVSGYEFGDKKGYGIIFIMESLDKTAPQASMYVTIINMDTKKVVATKRMAEKPQGFGFRNYWARPINDVLKDLEKKGYDKWKAEIK